MKSNFGTLFIVATPLGNLKDMSVRAIETLQTVNVIAAEDTRHSLPLLHYFSIKSPVISLHAHNERERTVTLLERLEQNESIALISDAGTPLISDPGYLLVHEARSRGIPVVAVPGPCAAIAALSVAGLPTGRFVFEGFLPTKASTRQARLAELRHEQRTMIFYEAPHRILTFLAELRELFGQDRVAVLARELTKVFETVYAAPLGELYAWVAADSNQQRGEMVVLVAGAPAVPNEDVVQHVLAVLVDALPLKQAVELAVKITGAKKNDLYTQGLIMKEHNRSGRSV